MMAHQHLILLVSLLLFTLVGCGGSKQPNVLFIICDSLDGRLLLDPNRPFPAPSLDRMIQKGVTFSNAYSNSPICTPARAAMWSGRHINEVQAWSNDKGLPANYTPTFASTLSENGYYNYIRGKEDYTSGDHSESGNVEDWTRSVPFVNLTMQPQPTTVMKTGAGPHVETADWNNTMKFAKWLHEDAKHNQPYLAYLGVDIPHPWPTRALNWQHVDVGGDSTFGTSDYWLPMINTSKIKVPKWLPWSETHPVDQYSSISKNMTGAWSPAQIVQIRQYYYAMCAELDGMLGLLLDALEQSGTANNTYVIFTSDHGEMAMEHRQYFKMTYYEASSHVPLVITGRWSSSSFSFYFSAFISLLIMNKNYQRVDPLHADHFDKILCSNEEVLFCASGGRSRLRAFLGMFFIFMAVAMLGFPILLIFRHYNSDNLIFSIYISLPLVIMAVYMVYFGLSFNESSSLNVLTNMRAMTVHFPAANKKKVTTMSIPYSAINLVLATENSLVGMIFVPHYDYQVSGKGGLHGILWTIF
eukprot:TRINITY_DN14197_c0_g1_i1.p1 TRINITY_DN14197_c0_g1~~TRINITY_DN14197_c0_g1_i1.p1  ORF type:complete len:537 (+),score=91.84 TRINITY_DN14197_c0_g1_i1:31-1611(+)